MHILANSMTIHGKVMTLFNDKLPDISIYIAFLRHATLLQSMRWQAGLNIYSLNNIPTTP